NIDESSRSKIRERLRFDSVHLEKSRNEYAGFSSKRQGHRDISIGEHRHQKTFRRFRGQAARLRYLECETRRPRDRWRVECAARRANARAAKRTDAKARAGNI